MPSFRGPHPSSGPAVLFEVLFPYTICFVLRGGRSFLFLSGVDKGRMRRQRALQLNVQAPRHCSVAVEITSSGLTEVCALDLRERRTNGMQQMKRFESASCKGNLRTAS